MTSGALLDAAATAPTDPGVYFFLSADHELLYVGKAGNLRRRLLDHARVAPRAGDRIDAVRWEVCADEDAALSREADLIVMLRPPFNASHTEQDPHCYLAVDHHHDETTFTIVRTTVATGRVYGTFPHVAKGAASKPAKRTKAGYTALLRILWAAQTGSPDVAGRIPSRISGGSPPTRHHGLVDPTLRPFLHEFLVGRSSRLLGRAQAVIAAATLPDYVQPALDRDLVAARAFYDLGPRRVQELRRHHRLSPGPVAGDVMAAILADELRSTLGALRVADPPARGTGPRRGPFRNLLPS